MKALKLKGIFFSLLAVLTVAVLMTSCEQDSVIEDTIQYTSLLELDFDNKSFEEYAQDYIDTKNLISTLDYNLSEEEILNEIFSKTHPLAEERETVIENYLRNLNEYKAMGLENTLQTMYERGIITDAQRHATLNVYLDLDALKDDSFSFYELKQFIKDRFEAESLRLEDNEIGGFKLMISPLYGYLNSLEVSSSHDMSSSIGVNSRGCSWWNFLPCVTIGGVSGIGVGIGTLGNTEAGANAAEDVLDWCCGCDDPAPPPPTGNVVRLFEGNNGTQGVVADINISTDRNINFTNNSCCQNDEARSAILYNMRRGQQIALYDDSNPACSGICEDSTDDWVIIEINRDFPEYTVNSFESPFSDADVSVTYGNGGNLDGKVSRFRSQN